MSFRPGMILKVNFHYRVLVSGVSPKPPSMDGFSRKLDMKPQLFQWFFEGVPVNFRWDQSIDITIFRKSTNIRAWWMSHSGDLEHNLKHLETVSVRNQQSPLVGWCEKKLGHSSTPEHYLIFLNTVFASYDSNSITVRPYWAAHLAAYGPLWGVVLRSTAVLHRFNWDE